MKNKLSGASCQSPVQYLKMESDVSRRWQYQYLVKAIPFTMASGNYRGFV